MVASYGLRNRYIQDFSACVMPDTDALKLPDVVQNQLTASSLYPYNIMWLADGDSLMCYIVRMSRLIA